MHTVGSFEGASRNLKGDLTITFSIPDDPKLLDKLEQLKDKDIKLDINKNSDKRSLNANAYFWKLVTELGHKLGFDKDQMYIRQLSRYGVFQDIIIKREALPHFEKEFRYVEIFDDGYEVGEMLTARCYFGSSLYTTKEMSDLIEGTVNDCHDLGIDTWSKEEIDYLLSIWEGEVNEKH